MKKKAWLVTLVASLGAGAVLAQSTNTVAPAAPSTPAPAPAISTPAPEAVPTVAPAAAPADAAASTNAATHSKVKKKTAAKKPVAKAVSTGLPAAHVLLDPAVPATVKVDSLNLRGQPSLSGEVIAKLKKGETVTILEEVTLDKARPGEPAKWARVTLPTNTPVWVSAHLVDPATKAVIPNRLNVRGGPGENFNVVARLDKGATVKEIRKNQDWLEIETPANASAYVSADLLEKQSTVGVPKIEDKVATPVVTKPEVASTKVIPHVEPIKVEPTPIVAAPTVTTTIEPDTNNVVLPAVDATNTPAAQPGLIVPGGNGATPAVATDPTVPSVPAVVTPAPTLVEVPATTPTVKDEILPKRIVNREGILTKAYNIQAPTYFELHDATTGELLDYLNPTKPELDLKRFIGKKIIVTGEEAMDRRWKFTPVIQVDSLLDAEN